MKRIFCVLLAMYLLLLCGCDGGSTIVGVWEQEIRISILGVGVEDGAAAPAMLRLTFREDGTGTMETILSDYPDSSSDFSYSLEGDRLLLDYGQGRNERFTVSLEKDTLALDASRVAYDLKRVQ